MTSDNKLAGLDHLRALAITLVFLFHYGRLFPHPQWTNTISKFGWTGVDLFFVLSGFLISSQLFRDIKEGSGVDARTFYLKRFFRIIPPYLVTLAIYFAFPCAREREALAPAWRYLTFTQNLGLDVSKTGTFSHAWSLCIEEQFYLVLPIVLMILYRFKWLKTGLALLALLFVGGLATRYALYQHFVTPYLETDDAWPLYWYKWIYYPTFCRLDSLLAGIGIAALFTFGGKAKDWVAAKGNYLLVAGLAVLTAAYFICTEETSLLASVAGFPAVAIGYGLVVAGAVSPGRILYKYSSGITAYIAKLSYAVYLVHKSVVHITQDLLSGIGIPNNSTLMFFCCSITVLAAAYLVHLLIEKPSLYLRKKYVDMRQNGLNY